MSNLVQLPNRRNVREVAAAWLVSIEEGLTETERGELNAWLAADAAHGDALVAMARKWDAFNALSELAQIVPLHSRRAATPRFSWKLGAVAASVVAVVAVAGWFTLRPDGFARLALGPEVARFAVAADQPVAQAAAATVEDEKLQTTVGKQLTSQLVDGSVVTLNTDTSVDVRYTDAERAVTLNRGEAIFSVAHNKQRPFRVTAGSHVVQAVGTVFNVRRFGEEVRVTVSEGAVKVFDPGSGGSAQPEVLVSAGEVAVIDASGAHLNRIDATRLEASQAWQHGLLIYQGETLDTVITDISRYTSVKFEIEDDSIRSKRVGGLFRTGDVDGLLLALRESFGIDPRREGDVIYLSARKQ